MVSDLLTLTEGRPYALSLTCHYIWEALRDGTQTEFELSDHVLERVISDLSGLGDTISTETVEAIEAIGELDEDTFNRSLEIVPFAGMTLEQAALARLAPSAFSDDEFASTLAAVRDDVELFVNRGVLRRNDERFDLNVSQESSAQHVWLYYQYVARRREAEKPAARQQYAAIMAAAFGKQFSEEVFGSDWKESTLVTDVRARRRDAPVHVEPVPREFELASEAGDLHRMRKAGLFAFGQFRIDARPDSPSAVYTALSFDHRFHRFDVCRLGTCSDPANLEDLGEEVAGWIEANTELMEKYGVRVAGANTAVIDGGLVRDFIISVNPFIAAMRVEHLFAQDKDYPGYARELEHAREVISELEVDSPWTPITPYILADLDNRIGFVRALEGELQTAETAFATAIGRNTERSDKWLYTYNLGQKEMAAERGGFFKAGGTKGGRGVWGGEKPGGVFFSFINKKRSGVPNARGDWVGVERE